MHRHTELDEAMQLVGDTTISFFLGGLAVGLAVFSDSEIFRWLCKLAAAIFLWLGYYRPAHANRSSALHRGRLFSEMVLRGEWRPEQTTCSGPPCNYSGRRLLHPAIPAK